MRSCVILALAIALAGCAVEEDPFVVEPGGKSDGSGFPVLEGELGETFADLEVSATGEHRDRLVLVRLRLEPGASLIATMRASSPQLDSYLLLKNTASETLAESDWQALLPMARLEDAVVSYTATTREDVFLFAAGGRNMSTGGSFRLDLVGLSSAPDADLSNTNPGVRAVTAELRENEPVVADYLERGLFVERLDGLVEVGTEAFLEIPLQERAQVRGHEQRVNDLRETLFAEHARASEGDTSNIAAAVAEVWAQARQ